MKRVMVSDEIECSELLIADKLERDLQSAQDASRADADPDSDEWLDRLIEAVFGGKHGR